MMDAWRSAMVLLGQDPRAEALHRRLRGEACRRHGRAAGGFRCAALHPRATDPGGDQRRHATASSPWWRRPGQGLTAHGRSATKGFLPGLEEVGRRFEKNSSSCPRSCSRPTPCRPASPASRRRWTGQPLRSRGQILMATVEGDIHDIGKNIVCTLLENHGFEVIDLGKNVSAATHHRQAARQHKVDAVGLSALMTTTMSQMDDGHQAAAQPPGSRPSPWSAARSSPRNTPTASAPTCMPATPWRRWPRSKGCWGLEGRDCPRTGTVPLRRDAEPRVGSSALVADRNFVLIIECCWQIVADSTLRETRSSQADQKCPGARHPPTEE